MATYSSSEWLRIATAGIVSPKERAVVKQELEDHMEDHAQVLMSISTGLSRGQAMERACAAMGDPHEVGRLLRKTHQPVLTRLLTLCRRAAIALAVVTVWITLVVPGVSPRLAWLARFFPADHPDTLITQVDPLPEGVEWRMIARPQASARAGDYTVTLQRVSLTWHQDTSECVVFLELQFLPDHFWQEDPIPGYDFILRNPAGEWTAGQALEENLLPMETLSRRRVTVLAVLDHLPTQLELEYRGPEMGFTLPIDLSGGVIYEN